MKLWSLVKNQNNKELKINDSPDQLSAQEQSATVRMLIQSRSGVYHSYVGGSPGMKKGQSKRNSYKPGSHWYYNNWDFNTLGTIFEQETKTSIGESYLYPAFGVLFRNNSAISMVLAFAGICRIIVFGACQEILV